MQQTDRNISNTKESFIQLYNTIWYTETHFELQLATFTWLLWFAATANYFINSIASAPYRFTLFVWNVPSNLISFTVTSTQIDFIFIVTVCFCFPLLYWLSYQRFAVTARHRPLRTIIHHVSHSCKNLSWYSISNHQTETTKETKKVKQTTYKHQCCLIDSLFITLY